MGLPVVRHPWLLALAFSPALISLAGCAESPTPSYARPVVPYGYGTPAYAYGAMTCGNGPVMYSNAPGYAQAANASYGQGYPATPLRPRPGETTGYGVTRQVYTPVFCQVGYGASYAPAATPSPALWTWPAAEHAQAAALPPGRGEPAPGAPAFGSTSSGITIYTSVGCGPCKNLQHKLNDRSIPFATIDVDQNREAYLRAQVASGGKSGVPLTDINQGQQDVWILGDDADAVEHAYRQN